MQKFTRRQFLKSSGIATVGILGVDRVVRARPARKLTLYVGTYTNGNSEGIYVYRMDQASGELTRVSSIKSENPSFLALDSSRRYLYAVNEVNDFGDKPVGAVSAFAINPTTGKLSFLNKRSSMGADPCYLTVDRKRRNVLVANYSGGNVAVLPVLRNGRLGHATELKQHQGSSVKDRQQGPHAHCIVLDQSNRHALAVDLGIDKVMIYRFDSTTGKLRPGKQLSASLQPGAGPRHVAFHPNGQYVYVIAELDSTLTTFKYDEVRGTLLKLGTVSTLPVDFTGENFCADVHLSANGRFLYGSNRGHDSIVVFAIDRHTRLPQQVEHVSTEGKWPRNFTIDPTGRFLLVANQRSDNVVTFRIDAKTGRLKHTGQVTEIPSPVCLKFAPRAHPLTLNQWMPSSVSSHF